jgi:hypothetical protein
LNNKRKQPNRKGQVASLLDDVISHDEFLALLCALLVAAAAEEVDEFGAAREDGLQSVPGQACVGNRLLDDALDRGCVRGKGGKQKEGRERVVEEGRGTFRGPVLHLCSESATT